MVRIDLFIDRDRDISKTWGRSLRVCCTDELWSLAGVVIVGVAAFVVVVKRIARES